MNRKLNSRLKIIYITIVLAVLGVIILNSSNRNTHLNYESISYTNDITYTLKTSEYWNLTGSPIFIFGDSGWDSMSANEWVRGSGTPHDPYIIENITMDIQAMGTGIEIRYSSKYFIIRNCTLYNSGSGINEGGIFLSEVMNG